jgi:cyclopropane fatty-acyl-phospholipid synthase-like methyltransferase
VRSTLRAVPDEATSDRSTEYYDRLYGSFSEQLYAAIRGEAFGEDIGQNSWLTADEHRQFCEWLSLDASHHVLEIASGSGGPALFMARTTGCRVTGVDIHEAGVAAGEAAAADAGLADRVRFIHHDAQEPLPWPDESFDCVVCIDSINHFFARSAVFAEWHRVLRADGRMLFTDPVTVTGLVRRDEMQARSAGMGEFVFASADVDRRLVAEAGFELDRVDDLSDGIARVAATWRDARERHRLDLQKLEGADAFHRLQQTLDVASSLAREKRVSRIAYLARRP